jgi:hypothetical protein
MAGNIVNVEFAGDSASLAKASKKASDSVESVGKASTGASTDMAKNSKESGSLLDSYSKLGNAVSGASDAIGDVTDGLSALSSATSINYEKQQKQQRALNDVAQAQEDLNQAVRDGSQATIDSGQSTIDATQATLDLATATKQHAADVKEYGANSLEAKQDTIDMSQAQQDLKQAHEDGLQAQRDASQATIDAKGAQLDLNDAQREANPPDLAKWAGMVETYAPLLQGLVGVTGLITAAQWAWNAAQAASPTTWIIIAIVALVAIVVIIATKTKWFQNIWKVAWSGIKTAAKASWDFIKQIPGWIGTAFSKIGSAIASPFREAFNLVASAWNNTVGRLNWTVPGWVPGIGGNSIGVPQLPHFHEGGTVPGTPGSNVLAMLQGGEEVTSVAGAGGGGMTLTIDSRGSGLDDLLVEIISKAVRGRGGSAQRGLGGRNGRSQ